MAKNLIEQVLKTVRNYEMLRPGYVVLAACSGGPDSVFLLHALLRLKKKLRLTEIAVCNLDHGLRGEESAVDSLFVKELARKSGCTFIHKKVTLPGLKAGGFHSSGANPAPSIPGLKSGDLGGGVNLQKGRPKGLSIEEIAREVRYDFYKRAAAKVGANVIATGHTLDDQAETVLMRVIKGASFKGLIGIAPSRAEGNYRIARPIIELEKSDIIAYLDHEKIDYRIDSTNAEPIYFRNIIRAEIIPFLERFNPRLKRVLFNMAEHLREDFDFIDRARSGAAGLILLAKDGGAEINMYDLAILPKAIQKEILRDLLAKAGGDVKKLSFRHWKELEGLIVRKGKGSSLHLPGGIKAVRCEKSLKFSRI